MLFRSRTEFSSITPLVPGSVRAGTGAVSLFNARYSAADINCCFVNILPGEAASLYKSRNSFLGKTRLSLSATTQLDIPLAKITGVTTGKIVDYGITDSMNMGAAMAPAACDTIVQHFEDFKTKPSDYDKIITGDLSRIGSKLLIDLLREKKIDISDRHMDCGLEIFKRKEQDVHAGGSGCGCSAVILASYILPQIQKKIWKRVLFVPTGALLSKISFNEGASIPGIAHAVVIEALDSFDERFEKKQKAMSLAEGGKSCRNI